MTAAAIWKQIRATALQSTDSEQRSAYLDATAARTDGEALVLYAPNQFISEVLASVRSQIRDHLPAPLKDVVIRLGTPAEYANRPAAGELAAVASDAPSTTSKGSRLSRRSRHITDPNSSMLQAVWPRNQRGMPADLLRSSLFTVNRYGLDTARPQRQNELMHSVSSFSLYVTGEETNIFDADVHAQLLHYQRNQPFGTMIWFSLRELCVDLDLSPNGINIARVRASIERMRNTRIVLKHHGDPNDKKVTYDGNMILSFLVMEDSSQDRWSIELSTQLTYLLAPGLQSRYPVEVDRRLKSTLARYLLRFYSTHTAQVYPMKVDTLRKFSGTRQEIREFRRSLRIALQELQDEGFLQEWSMEDDKVSISRTLGPKRLTQEQIDS
ncbi:replication initiator protein A (plasmid) [Xanthomonas citri pv. citri]|uniref:plasmid replication initiator TrfA n=1 Tax=Xanthomonas citri TaxID=346 RepID=UPI001931B9F8|nr:plasmid replication initiator TrfA [Xanthomonas citri]QRD62644.1 replication initiator protein A [Xanthomonas citri pv. citri]QRD67179.1 replication initiator protein A [Xanthomonas citri pv. citri]QRD71776.1 replication initiator protein A [Xanthomonas citri pv. citri]